MLNKVILMGRLTTDPEHKQTPNGLSVTSFSLAVERNFADKSGKRGTDFINIVAWRGTADLISKFFKKGKLIALEGSIQTRNYEDKKGNKRTAFEVIADQVYFTGEKTNSNKTNSSANSTNSPTPPVPTGDGLGEFEEIDTDESDLPF